MKFVLLIHGILGLTISIIIPKLVLAEPEPSCGTISCGNNADCAGVSGGCTVCGEGSCAQPACGDRCDNDAVCAGANSCTKCLYDMAANDFRCAQPTCGTSCGNDAVCKGASDGCTKCIAGACQTPSNAGVQGDPHFKTWHGNHFSYHGECDLVLLKNDQFRDGLGIIIHVRTKIEKTWSYVKNAAVKIGHDIIEIEGKGQVWDKSADAVHSINGIVNAELPYQLARKFPFTRLIEKQCNTNGAKCIEAIVYKIDLGDSDNILITQKWGVIKVSVTANDKNKFHDTVGLMGHFNKPGFLARDGNYKIIDFNQFGQEWQVLQSEPMIFNERRAPQHPEQCTLPIVTTKRRLGEDTVLHQMAEEACAGVEEASREFCIFDVTAAGTAEAASTYYTAYVG